MELIHDELSGRIIASARKLIREKPAGKLTVRDILKDLQITNRVFYNRFRNLDEVWAVLYTESTQKVRESLSIPWDGRSDFGAHIQAVADRTLALTYESRQHISQYIFESDSVADANFSWWLQEIQKIMVTGKRLGYLRPKLDEDAISYSIWCFIRGFGADAIARDIPQEEALRQFHCGFGCLLQGMKA